MNHLHWFCYRPPVSHSLKTLLLGFCTVREKAMALLAAAIERGSVLTEFDISSWSVDDADITRIILGENRLEKFLLHCYDLGETEIGAFLLAARKRNQWQHLNLGLYTPGNGFNLNTFTWSLRVASKSPGRIRFYSNGGGKPPDIFELMNLKQIAFGDRVKF